jgi:hypothetical protein
MFQFFFYRFLNIPIFLETVSRLELPQKGWQEGVKGGMGSLT